MLYYETKINGLIKEDITMKLISSLGCVTRMDDIRHKRLWMIDPVAEKIYDLYVVQAYSIDNVAKTLGMDVCLIDAIVNGIRLHYKITVAKLIKNRINMKLLPFTIRKLERQGVLK